MKRTSLRLLFAAAAAALGARLILGQARSRRKRIPARTAPPGEAGSLSVILPVLNERDRVSGALEGLIVQGPWLREIIVVDGGSTDGTNEIIDWYTRRDPRVRFVDGSPRPEGWNARVWSLNVGLDHVDPEVTWILTAGADLRPRRDFTASLIAFAHDHAVDGLTIANTRGFLGRRSVIERTRVFERSASSFTPDSSIARTLAADAFRVDASFADGLVSKGS